MTISDALESAPEKSVAEIQRQAEACLAGTVQMAIASMQRATTLAGIATATAVALSGAGIASLVRSGGSLGEPLAGGALSAAALLVIAAAVFIYSARPLDFHLPGYEPERLSRVASDPKLVVIYSIEDVQKRIGVNRVVLERAARPFFAGCALAALSMPVGAVVAWSLIPPS